MAIRPTHAGQSETASFAAPAKVPAAEFVPGEVLVRFRAGAGASKRAGRTAMTLPTSAGQIPATVEPLAANEFVAGLRLARVAPGDTLVALEAFRQSPDVLYAEPNYVWRKLATPNDPRFGELTGLRNDANPNADIDAEQAWDITTGSRNIVVGVIDEGIDINHVDLRANIWTNPGELAGNGIDDDGNGFVDDVHGWDFFHNDASVYDGPGTNADGVPVDAHGTHVAGTIGATGNNGVGVVGVNWQVALLPLKFLGPDGGSTADAIRAYDYARTLRALWVNSGGARGANIRVLNNSYGGGGRSQSALDAIRALGDAGILFVAAAGNETRDNDRFPVYPANYKTPNMVAVAAADRFGGPASRFSNRGQRTVDTMAPGENILSTTPGDTYTRYSGTSMAAPHAAGTAALVCAVYPDISLPRLRAALVYGGTAGYWDFTAAGRRVNARTALDNAAESDNTPPAAVANLSGTSQGNQSYTLQWNAPGDDGNNGTAAVYEVRYADADLTNAAQFEQAYRLYAPQPAAAGALQTVQVVVPFRHTGGYIGVRAIDNAGNAGPVALVAVNIDQATADPYVVNETATEPLSTGGTPLNFHADDQYYLYQLPFDFTYFGGRGRFITISTNGALHQITPTTLLNGQPDVDSSSVEYLSGRRLIAGLWDDLRTDRRAGDDVYVVQPDPTRIIFRWQAVTFDTPLAPGVTRGEQPVNFEIELRRDGTISTRYGDGNHNLLPVVGISAGEPDPYLVESHTSATTLKDLAFAPTVTYTPRRPVPLPAPDLAVSSIRTTPDVAASGRQLTYSIDVANYSADQDALQTSVVNQLPAGVSFISCATTRGTCAGPAVGTSGPVNVNLGTLPANSNAIITLLVSINAPAGSTLTDTATIADYWNDPNPANNTATLTTPVQQAAVFNGVRSISASGGNGTHTLALKTDGTVWAWGDNLVGQLGDGTSANKTNVPVQVVDLDNVTAVDTGAIHSLALKADGTVWGWGWSDNGQLGGTFTPGSSFKSRPVQVAGLDGVFTAIAAGSGHTLALKADGTVWACGSDNSGQLGRANTFYSTANFDVQPVQNLTNVTALAGGSDFSLAVKTDGTVWAWGSNRSGVLGQPASTSRSNVPLQVGGIGDVVAVSGGNDHVVALKRDGTVWAWGSNADGQLGNGDTGSGPTPRQVTGLTGIVAISAGGAHTTALKADGTVWSWGRNANGQLGDGTTSNRNLPVQLAGVAPAVAGAAGNTHGGAVLADGSVRMWGANNNGQLADRTYVTRLTPTEVSGPYAPAPPRFSPDGGSFAFPQGVTLSCDTPGALIRYTTNGADPTANDPAVNSGGVVILSTTLTLKARAYKLGWPASDVKSAQYIFPAPTPTPTPTPAPGADTQPIAFTRALEYNETDIFLINPDGSGAVDLTNHAGRETQSAWSPDGTKIAYTDFGLASDFGRIFVMNADGSEQTLLSTGNTNDRAPVWSPDGTRIAYVSQSSNDSLVSDIWVMGADGTNAFRLTNNTAQSGKPSWSPDGTKIVYTLNGWIYITPADHIAAPTRLTINAAFDFAPVFSPDGTKIAFAHYQDDHNGSNYTNYEIYVMNADGTNSVRLTNSPYIDQNPAWSADGTKIVFESQRDGFLNYELYVMSADGSNQVRLTNHDGQDSSPAWRQRTPVQSPTQLQFGSATYSAAEGAGAATITVTRTGDLSGTSAVDYRTTDDPAAVRCDDTVNNHGAAYARCDYATSLDTLTFAPGAATKTFTIPLLDDAYVEGNETVQLALSRPVGAGLGGQRTATLTITDNDTTAGPNPVRDNRFFVRQHYLDFLSREPETDGLNAWLGVLSRCPDPNNTDPNSTSAGCDRLTVSAAFFGSQEFQLKGFYVFRFYRTSFGRLPTYAEIVTDMRSVTGQTADEVFAKRNAFASAWVLRADFRAQYNGFNDGNFIDRLLLNAGVQQLTGPVTRDTLLGDLQAGRKTRAEVVRAIVEHADVQARAYNPAFVAMQYYGYLRRDPESAGYIAWLTYLTTHPNDARTMVNGFMNSTEYRLRFGPPN